MPGLLKWDSRIVMQANLSLSAPVNVANRVASRASTRIPPVNDIGALSPCLGQIAVRLMGF
jgi:hypothetical protein